MNTYLLLLLLFALAKELPELPKKLQAEVIVQPKVCTTMA